MPDNTGKDEDLHKLYPSAQEAKVCWVEELWLGAKPGCFLCLPLLWCLPESPPATPVLDFLPTGWWLKPRKEAHLSSLILYDVTRLPCPGLHFCSYSNEQRFLSRPGKKSSISLYFLCNKGRSCLQCLWAKASGPWRICRSLLILFRVQIYSAIQCSFLYWQQRESNLYQTGINENCYSIHALILFIGKIHICATDLTVFCLLKIWGVLDFFFNI